MPACRLFITCLVVVCCAAATLRASIWQPFGAATTVDANTFLSYVSPAAGMQKSAQYIRPNVAGFSAAAGGSDAVALRAFPIGDGATGDVELRRVRPVVDANTVLLAGNKQIPVPLVETYVGRIAGEEGSRVFVCAVGTCLVASIQRADGSVYTLAPAVNTKDASVHALQREGMAAERKFVCAAGDMLHQLPVSQQRVQPQPKTPRALSNTLLEVEVAVESDTKFFKETGGTVEKATAYIVSLMSLASVIYEDELNVRFYLPWIKVWTTDTKDPYNSDGNAYDLAPKALAYWGDHYKEVKRDLVHVLTSGGGGGIGYQFPLDNGGAATSLCTESGLGASSPFADHTFPTLDFTYGVYIVAHEMGHSFGAVHSHSCFWNPALDTCMTRDDADYKIADACCALPVKPRASSGSIMSYCAGINAASGKGYGLAMTFLPPVAAYMRNQVEQSACVTEPVQPVVILTSPRGGQAYKPGDDIKVTWTSARVNQMILSYSPDGGTHWLPVVESVSAASREFIWTAPAICSRKILMRIADRSNSAVADTSILPFSIVNESDCLLTELLFRNGSTHNEACSLPDVIVENAVPDKNRRDVANNAYSFSSAAKARIIIPEVVFDKPVMTVSFWVRYTGGKTPEFKSVVGTDWEHGALFQAFVADEQLSCAFWTKESPVPVSVWCGDVSNGNWVFVSVVCAEQELLSYANGQLRATELYEGTLATGAPTVYIGSRGEKEYFDGSIDDVRLFCRALSQDEVLDLYMKETTAPQAPTLLGPRDVTSVGDENLVQFTWVEMPTVTAYHVQIATESTFEESLFLEKNDIHDPELNVKIFDIGKTYYWRVACRNTTGEGPWSEVWSFVPMPSTSVGEVQTGAALAALSPNPATDIVAAHYTLASAGSVRLVLYNSMGQELRTVDAGWKQPGTFSLVIPTADLPAGVYFLKLFTGGAISAQKMVIVR